MLLLAYATEAAQYCQLLRHLGWQQVPWLRLLLGSRFAWADLAAYTAGVAVVLAVEALRGGPLVARRGATR